MKLLLTGAFDYNNDQIKELEYIGYEITYIKEEREKLNIDVSVFDGVVCNNLFLYNDIKEFKSLKIIQLTSAGLDRVPLEYIKDNNITIYNAKGVYSKPIAEYVVGKILEVYKKSHLFYEQQKTKLWKKHYDLIELTNKKVAILGYGDIGSEIAKRLKAFEVEIYAFDLYEPKTSYHKVYDHLANIDKYLKNMDVVVISLPLTKETKHLVSKDFLNNMNSSSLLINVSRGQIIKESDLITHLKEKKTFTAFLDVFEEEPLSPKSEFWNLKNIFITPHNAYASLANKNNLFDIILENLKEINIDG